MAFSRIRRLDPPHGGISGAAAVMLCSLLASLILLHLLSERCAEASPHRVPSEDLSPPRSAKRLGFERGPGSGLPGYGAARRATRALGDEHARRDPEPREESLVPPPPDSDVNSRRASPRFAGKISPLGEGSKKLPQALIVGVKKGGTRALLEFLRVHPDIRAVGAEPHFFDRNYEKGLQWYRSRVPAFDHTKTSASCPVGQCSISAHIKPPNHTQQTLLAWRKRTLGVNKEVKRQALEEGRDLCHRVATIMFLACSGYRTPRLPPVPTPPLQTGLKDQASPDPRVG
ncbi:unnamed protein product [Menidia menidia]|uniref:Sulfotransferase n=1 Tax=Menidia menidia TaxID=238744 RepID=A0A8S4AX06_9TELE|nr:unnamed protein product [Menidia menidia]